ncbi:anaphase-promoting complex subunit 11 [Penicillium taxi]|uniref:anaphase-promoting complex subunit 11 n=1 Tax=Penicillium taxi TaxID=168475 RepID=UPI0025450076|nr:anaphase-promoting complex subunit 11 [Penicillium taxi]KAJ5895658.1 anaphase-promoting complex subunit 11 [Penicillium taxi]
MRIILREWNSVAIWRWNLPEDDVCGICRVQYDSTCPRCKIPGDGCPIRQGQCKHAFHWHCLEAWFKEESAKELCPMCRQKFVANI